MKAVFVVLTDSEQVSLVMEGLVEVGVKGATVVNSKGMTGYLKDPSPFLSRIRHLTGSGQYDNYTVFSVVEDNCVKKVLKIVEEVTGGLDEHGVGVAFVVPVDEFRG